MARSGMSRRSFLAGAGGVVVGGAIGKRVALARGDDGGPPPAAPDVIFIGAGINSLGAAVLLGEAGWRVLVLDRNADPGGCIRTLELTLPGFRHDIGAMNLGLLAGSPFFKERREALAARGLDLIVADHSYGSVTADGGFLGISTDPEANLGAIARHSEADVAAWKTWRADFELCAPKLFEVFGSPAADSGPLALAFGKEGPVPEGSERILRRILLESLRSNLTRRFESDAVQALIAAWGLHLDYAPDIAGGCWMPFLETNVDERFGIPIARGGSGKLIEALTRLVRDQGGEVRTGRHVDQIVIEQGRAVGVRLGSTVVRATRGVVASVTPQGLVALCGDALPDDARARAAAYRYGPGTLVIHLALSDLPPWRAPEARRSFYVHVSPSLDHLAAAYQESVAGQLPADPFSVVGQPTVYDASRAPEGKHVLWVMVRGVPAQIEGDAAGEIEGREWNDDVKGRFAERVLASLERYAPGLRERILGMAIHTPTDLQRLNPNLVGGDLNAGSLHLSQFYGNRPYAGAADHDTPIRDLYMIGASTWPGGGASPGSGTLLARRLLA